MVLLSILIAGGLCMLMHMILELKLEEKKRNLLIFLLIYVLLLSMHFSYSTMHSIDKTMKANRNSRYLSEIFERMDVSEEGDCDLLKKQVRYLHHKIHVVFHDEMEFTALVDWMGMPANGLVVPRQGEE